MNIEKIESRDTVAEKTEVPAKKKVSKTVKTIQKAVSGVAKIEKKAKPEQQKKTKKQIEPVNEAKKLKRKAYEKKMRELHEELVKLQQWVKHTGAKIVIVFEGRDGAGKGGTIKALTERTSPRVFRVVALPAPSDREKSQMYMQRYINHLPAGGEIVIFDRSWYNRAGVERVMGFTPEAKVEGFLGAVPWVENALGKSNIKLFKYWLEVSPDVQEARLKDRIKDKRKVWKLTDMDVKSFSRWDDYTHARDQMLAATDTDHSPWYIAHSDDKKQVRINIISHLLASIPYEKVPSKKVKLPDRKISKDHGKGLKSRKIVPTVTVEKAVKEQDQ
jgi:polyphosphate kinase 2